MLRSWCDGCRSSMLVAAMLLSAAGAGCDQGSTTQAQQKGAPPPPGVTVSKPLQREIVEWDEYTGRFDAVEIVEMRARVSGHLNEVRFKDGQAVKQGNGCASHHRPGARAHASSPRGTEQSRRAGAVVQPISGVEQATEATITGLVTDPSEH